MSEENRTIEEENKEVETSQETISDEAMSNIKDSSEKLSAVRRSDLHVTQIFEQIHHLQMVNYLPLKR